MSYVLHTYVMRFLVIPEVLATELSFCSVAFSDGGKCTKEVSNEKTEDQITITTCAIYKSKISAIIE